MNALKRLLSQSDGATMVEYAVMLALIAFVCIAIVASIGSGTSGLFAPINSRWNGI